MIEFSSKKSGQSDFGRGRQEDNLTRIMPRRLTDKFCLALFLLVVVLFSIVTFRNINSAEFQKAFRPIDSSGHVCGDRGEKEDSQLYKYLYIDTPSKTSGPLDRRVCVKSCPTSQNDTLDCLPNSKIASCSELGTHSSKLIAGRICIPDDVEFYKDISRQLYGVDTSTVFEAVVGNYKLLLLSVAIGFALSFLYSKLMSVCAFFIVLLTFCAAFLASSLVGMRLFKKNVDLMMEAEGAEDGLKMRKAAASYKLFAFIVWGVTAALILLFIMMMGRIRAAIGVLQTAGKFMTENKSIILVPIFGGLKVVAVVAIWSISMIAYYSKAQHLPSDYSTLGKVDLGNYKMYLLLTLVNSFFWYSLSCGVFLSSSQESNLSWRQQSLYGITRSQVAA